MVVSGIVENKSDEIRPVPAILIIIYDDKKEEELSTQLVPPPKDELAPGEKTNFRARLLDPLHPCASLSASAPGRYQARTSARATTLPMTSSVGATRPVASTASASPSRVVTTVRCSGRVPL